MPTIPSPAASEAREFLASTPLFGGLAAAVLDDVAAHLEWRLVPGGERVCREGEPAEGLFLVASGRLVVVRAGGDGHDTRVGERGRGDSFGEMSILTGDPHTATVRALRDTVLALLSRERSEALLRKTPEALLTVTRMLAGWLRPAPPNPAGGCLAVALAATGPEVPLAPLVDRLAAALSEFGPTLRLNAQRVDSRFGEGAAHGPEGSDAHGRLAAWLGEQELAHAFLVFEADGGGSAWTRRCLRQADRILVVAVADGEPSLGPLAAELARLEEDQGRQIEELVLLHDLGGTGSARPRGTAAWLALRRFAAHHHLRLAGPGDVERLARFLSGNAIGLVLGGGGARGFAHIGVLRACEEAGIAIDRIGGTSMGAVIGAQSARGCGWQELLELNRRGWVEMAPHKVYTLPLISILSSRKGEKMLDMMYGDDAIEDLWRSFFCVSTNITRAELAVHRQGPVRDAVSASMTLPGITPPIVAAGGDLLVDGGVLDNLPTDVMRSLGPGPIIAVDVSAAVDVRADPSYKRTPSPWRLLAGRCRLRSRLPPFPTILRLVYRSAVLASDLYAKQSKGQVELYLDVPVDEFDLFQMDALDRIADSGYRFARTELAAAGSLRSGRVRQVGPPSALSEISRPS